MKIKSKFFVKDMTFEFAIEQWLSTMEGKIRIVSSAIGEKTVMILYEEV